MGDVLPLHDGAAVGRDAQQLDVDVAVAGRIEVVPPHRDERLRPTRGRDGGVVRGGVGRLDEGDEAVGGDGERLIELPIEAKRKADGLGVGQRVILIGDRQPSPGPGDVHQVALKRDLTGIDGAARRHLDRHVSAGLAVLAVEHARREGEGALRLGDTGDDARLAQRQTRGQVTGDGQPAVGRRAAVGLQRRLVGLADLDPGQLGGDDAQRGDRDRDVEDPADLLLRRVVQDDGEPVAVGHLGGPGEHPRGLVERQPGGQVAAEGAPAVGGRPAAPHQRDLVGLAHLPVGQRLRLHEQLGRPIGDTGRPVAHLILAALIDQLVAEAVLGAPLDVALHTPGRLKRVADRRDAPRVALPRLAALAILARLQRQRGPLLVAAEERLLAVLGADHRVRLAQHLPLGHTLKPLTAGVSEAVVVDFALLVEAVAALHVAEAPQAARPIGHAAEAAVVAAIDRRGGVAARVSAAVTACVHIHPTGASGVLRGDALRAGAHLIGGAVGALHAAYAAHVEAVGDPAAVEGAAAHRDERPGACREREARPPSVFVLRECHLEHISHLEIRSRVCHNAQRAAQHLGVERYPQSTQGEDP